MTFSPYGNLPNREKSKTTLQFFLDNTEWESQAVRPKKVNKFQTGTPLPVRLYPGGRPGAWSDIYQKGGPHWCPHAHLIQPGGYSLLGLPHTQGYRRGIPTSSLLPVYPNGICGIIAFIFRGHRYGKGPGQQHHANVWRDTITPYETVGRDSSYPDKTNPGIRPN